MNILPKKRWHVRTKENIARVRRDEAKAREEEKEEKRRIELAEKEARTRLLRTRARNKYEGRENTELLEDGAGIKREHINFFKDLEEGNDKTKKKNEQYEKEKKEETEKYEKQIGYLTYLGQDTVESTGKISWFNKLPDRFNKIETGEVDVKKKIMIDPYNKVKFYLKKADSGSKLDSVMQSKKIEKIKKKKKKRKHKRSNSSSSDDRCTRRKKRSSSSSSEGNCNKRKNTLEELRAKRLKREMGEKARAAIALAKIRGEPISEPVRKQVPTIKQKYNSQFNPHIAKQNKNI